MAHTVLVVDDMAGTRALLRAYLEGRGCRVLEAGDGGEAFAAAQREKPDLIILDVQMPGVEGVPAANVLQNQAETASIPILIYSGNDESKVGQMITFGPKMRFVSKLADLNLLWDTVAQMLMGAGARRFNGMPGYF